MLKDPDLELGYMSVGPSSTIPAGRARSSNYPVLILSPPLKTVNNSACLQGFHNNNNNKKRVKHLKCPKQQPSTAAAAAAVFLISSVTTILITLEQTVMHGGPCLGPEA